MKYHFIFLVLFVFSKITPCHADNYIPYLNLTNKAEWLYDQGEYMKAKYYFDEAFELVDKIKYKDILLYSKILTEQNEHKKAYKLLKNHLKQTGGSLGPISSELERLNIQLSNKRLEKLDTYIWDTSSVKNKAELELLDQFEKLSELDQLVRMKNSGEDLIWWVSGKDSTQVSRYHKMIEIDSLNYIELLDLLPKIENLRLSEFYLSRLLIHMNYKHFISIETQLFDLVKDGILDPWVFARAKDRAYATQIDCPIYFLYASSYNKIDCTPLEEIKKNRLSIGLSTYYRRSSYSYYITPGRMMKDPFDDFYQSEIEEKK